MFHEEALAHPQTFSSAHGARGSVERNEGIRKLLLMSQMTGSKFLIMKTKIPVNSKIISGQIRFIGFNRTSKFAKTLAKTLHYLDYLEQYH
jgi:hypothetical protein